MQTYRLTNSLAALGVFSGGSPINGDINIIPAVRDTSGAYSGVEAIVAANPPPIEWPIIKSGMSVGGTSSCASINAAISERMAGVGPEFPISAWLLTELPQPR